MLENFKTHIENNLSFLKEGKLLIAISGGLDSVVLTQLCIKLDLNIALAHCNFNLRPSESDDDEAFVMKLANQFDLEVFVESFDTKSYAESEKLSIQMAARTLRYNWFKQLLNDLKYDFLLTAHHADDNLETFLINLTRGSGLNGLTGIPEINETVVRPLLPFTRAQLEDYAQENNLIWREDSSNASDDYLRNKMRHHIIPKLKEVDSNLISNFQKTISNLKDTADIVEESLNAVAKRAITQIDEHQIKFKVSEFIKVNNPKAYLFEMFKDYGFTEWNDVVNLLDAQSGKQVFSKTHRLLKDREHLILSERNNAVFQNEKEESITIHHGDDSIETSFGRLLIEEANVISETSMSAIFVDKSKLVFPLQIRKWRKGDVFYPLGMQGKKKLSKYFKDEKLSLVDKEQIWLLTSDENIVWIIGMRQDNRFGVTQETGEFLKISIQS